MFAGILSDLRFGLRQFRKSPRFFALLFSLLVLGVGATTAMFSITRALALRSLPFPEPDQLLMLWGRRMVPAPGGDLSLIDRSRVSLLDFQDWSQRASTLQQACVAHAWLYSLSSEGQPAQGRVGALVSGGFFPMLGVRPLLGRFFGPEDDQPGAAPVVVIGASVWQQDFASDPNVIGKTVLLQARPYTLVGVAPPGFDFSFPGNERAHIWTPLRTLPEEAYAWYASRQDIREWYAMARRKADASREEVSADLSRVAASAQPKDGSERIDVAVRDLRQEIVGEVVSPLLLRFVGVLLVFLAICSNVSSLLLVRAEARRGELAARAAFGATRARLMRQVLTETLLLFLLALPCSVLAASLMVDAFRDYTVKPSSTLAQLDVSVDPKTLFFGLGVCLSAGLLSGWLPALAASRVDLFSVLKQAGSGASIAGSRTGLRATLVVIQVALAFALLTSSGLALTALAEILHRPAGFEPEGLVTARLMGIRSEDDQPVRRNQLRERVMERLRATPGVQSVAANHALPLSGYEAEFEFEIAESLQPPRQRALANRNVVTPDYFETMRIPLLRGRTLLASDEAKDAPPVALISQRLALEYFPGEDPIGCHIRHRGADDGFHEIVGVVGDVRRNGLADPIELETYYPVYPEVGIMVIVARADQPARLLAELPRVVASLDPALGVWARRLDERMERTLIQPYRLSVVLGVFAAVALLLAALGLYALVSYTTTLKTREFGIRIALGSPLGALLWLVMRSGLVWLGLGSAFGLLAALVLGKALALAIPGVQSFDPGVYALVALALGLSGALASFVPARRTVRVSPASALRYE